MLNVNNKQLCSLCFAEIKAGKSRCDHCSGESNEKNYPTVLREGTVLAGKYSVGKVLGKGGFGVTYLCYDMKQEKIVAVKEYMPDSLSYRAPGTTVLSTYDGERGEHFKAGAEKFFDEAKLVSGFNENPNIISVYEFFYENNTAYFVMEYLDGADLKHYIGFKGGRIPEKEAVYVTVKAAEALKDVHGAEILHRDISPDNIFICRDGSVKLIDFGAARQVLGEASKSLSVILKQGFAPLEQYQRRGRQGPWTDIYALGATVHCALTGKVVDDAMSRLDDDTIETKGISKSFAALLRKMLEVKSVDRYQSMDEVIEAVKGLGIEAQLPLLPEKSEKALCKGCGREIEPGRTEDFCDECIKIKEKTITNIEKNNIVFTSDEEVAVEEDASENKQTSENKRLSSKKRIVAVAALIVVATVGITAGVWGIASKKWDTAPTVNEVKSEKAEIKLANGEKITLGELCPDYAGFGFGVSVDNIRVAAIESDNGTAKAEKNRVYADKTALKTLGQGVANIEIQVFLKDGSNTLIYEKSVKLTVELSETEKAAVETGIKVLTEKRDGAQKELDEKLADTYINHANCAEEEAALTRAVKDFSGMLEDINSKATVDEAEAFYNNAVIACMNNLNKAYDKAVEIADAENAPKRSSGQSTQSKSSGGSSGTKTNGGSSESKSGQNKSGSSSGNRSNGGSAATVHQVPSNSGGSTTKAEATPSQPAPEPEAPAQAQNTSPAPPPLPYNPGD